MKAKAYTKLGEFKFKGAVVMLEKLDDEGVYGTGYMDNDVIEAYDYFITYEAAEHSFFEKCAKARNLEVEV